MKIRVGHLYPDYLNIYADRGNMAVLARRAAWRGHELDVSAVSMGDALQPGEHDLFYIGGGQDREQALVAPSTSRQKRTPCTRRRPGARRCSRSAAATSCSAQFYRERDGVELPGIGLFPLHTIAGERRMIGDVLLDCAMGRPDARRLREPRRAHAPRRGEPRHSGASSTVSATTARAASKAAASAGRSARYLHGPLLPRNPWLADWLLAQALAHATGGEPPELEPLDDELEAEAHGVAAARARARGGRF